MPSPPSSILESLRLDLIQRCGALKDRAEQRRHSEFASKSPIKLLQLFADIARAIEKRLQALPATSSDLPFLDSFIREVSSQVRYAEAAMAERIPWSLSRPLELFARRFLGHVTILLRPQWTHNYSIIIDDLVKVYDSNLRAILGPDGADEVEGIFQDFPKPFFVVSFPALERMNLLLHCDLAHEIGHLVAEEFLENPSADEDRHSVDFQEKIRDRLRRDQAFVNLPTARQTRQIQELLNRVIKIRRSALEELISDQFAACAIGPAAFFALVSIVVSRPLDEQPSEESGFYPPAGIRLRLVHETLKQRGFLPMRLPEPRSSREAATFSRLAAYTRDLETFTQQYPLLTETQSLSFFEQDWQVKLAYSSVIETLPRVTAFLEGEHRKEFIEPSELYEPAVLLLERLAVGLPPNELKPGHPARLEWILNAAWLYRIGMIPTPAANASCKDMGIPNLATVNRLSLKAIEMARVQRDFLDKGNA